jgi:hypothetical protein
VEALRHPRREGKWKSAGPNMDQLVGYHRKTGLEIKAEVDMQPDRADEEGEKMGGADRAVGVVGNLKQV